MSAVDPTSMDKFAKNIVVALIRFFLTERCIIDPLDVEARGGA